MAFKSMVQYNEERYGNFFTLQNDGNFADVIFLYQSKADVLIADVHYIKSAEYSGYVHCCGTGCPACSKGIRTQTKLFIPLYNITERKIQFFDRSTKFESQLVNDVFDKFPDPSQYVFRITRHGVAGSVDTTYQIQAIGKNAEMPMAKILTDAGTKMPDAYSMVCKEVTPFELDSMINVTSSVAVPRDAYVPAPPVTVEVPQTISSFNQPVMADELPNFDAAIPAPVADVAPAVDDLKLPDAFAGDVVPSAPTVEGSNEAVDNVVF